MRILILFLMVYIAVLIAEDQCTDCKAIVEILRMGDTRGLTNQQLTIMINRFCPSSYVSPNCTIFIDDLDVIKTKFIEGDNNTQICVLYGFC